MNGPLSDDMLSKEFLEFAEATRKKTEKAEEEKRTIQVSAQEVKDITKIASMLIRVWDALRGALVILVKLGAIPPTATVQHDKTIKEVAELSHTVNNLVSRLAGEDEVEVEKKVMKEVDRLEKEFKKKEEDQMLGGVMMNKDEEEETFH